MAHRNVLGFDLYELAHEPRESSAACLIHLHADAHGCLLTTLESTHFLEPESSRRRRAPDFFGTPLIDSGSGTIRRLNQITFTAPLDAGQYVVEVTHSGETAQPIVVASEPPLLFDGAALRAVRTWRYSVDTDGSESPRQAIRLLFRSTEVDPDHGVSVLLDASGE